jgi:MtfA peptidase
MQIISKLDKAFIVFYMLLIILVGLLVFFISGQAIALFMTLLLLAFFLLLALKKPLRRLRALRIPWPPSWHEFLFSQSAYYRGLGAEAKIKFERDISLFLADGNIAGIGGAEVAWQTRLLIGAGVASMLHGRPEWEPPLPDGVTVYPGFSFDRNYQVEKGNIAGQAPERGPLLIAQESLKQGFANPGAGKNVLIHELAHYFDREQRKIGGRYSDRAGRGQGDSWADALTREWRKHLQHGSILPSYAALNEAEFFAVACEMFFENPWPLHAAHPELYGLLHDFYRQDPRLILAGRPG